MMPSRVAWSSETNATSFARADHLEAVDAVPDRASRHDLPHVLWIDNLHGRAVGICLGAEELLRQRRALDSVRSGNMQQDGQVPVHNSQRSTRRQLCLEVAGEPVQIERDHQDGEQCAIRCRDRSRQRQHSRAGNR
jgi:hypothetical protein